MALLLAGCGGGSGAAKSGALDARDSDAGTTQTAPPTTAGGAGGLSTSPATKGVGGAAASTSASAPAQQASTAAKAARGSSGGSTGGAATTAPSAAAPEQAATAIKVDTKCRKAASSVGTGVAVKGQRPPGFTATTVDCGSLDFAAYTKGKPTLVNFFSSWCQASHNDAKDLEAVYEKYHSSKGFTVVGVDTDDEDGSPSWFYNNAHWTFPSVWDDDEKIKKAWAISACPALFWIHPDGTISSIFVGDMSRSQMEEEINKL